MQKIPSKRSFEVGYSIIPTGNLKMGFNFYDFDKH